MPRKAAKKSTNGRRRRATPADRVNRLTISMPEMNLTVEASDSGLISGILDQLNILGAAATGTAPAPPARRGPGRPAKRGRPVGAPAARGTSVSKADISSAFGMANPTNHEQRILLLGYLLHQKGQEIFTTNDVSANASAIGVSQSTIPGSLSKLKSRKLISAKKEGRRALYSLTAQGQNEVERMLRGEVTAPRRGRRAGTGRKGKAKRGPGRPPKAESEKKKGRPGRKPGRKKPGPKPGRKRGRKPGPKPKAKVGRPAGKSGRKPKPRGATKAEALSPQEKEKADKLLKASLNGSENDLKKLKTPKDRSLWLLQSLSSAVGNGVKAKLLSYVLQSRFNLRVPANAIGAALKKSLNQNLVTKTSDSEYAITMEGRKYLDKVLSEK